jgi:phosphatidylglycerol:prolipoprotein diacylglycerol transferase
MYPRLSDLFRDVLGIPFPVPIYSFGVMVAVAILVGTWLGGRELDRKYAAGLIGGVEVKTEDGRTVEESPSILVGTLAVLAGVMGIVGAKLFTILGNPGRFLLDPAGMLFSTGGLTFYGGLIVAGAAIVWYLRRYDLSVAPVADAAAPGLMLAYGIGRIGCHLAGDGDWGIPADLAAKPDWWPMWLWAETYPNAIVGPPPQPVYPTSVYEALAATVLFGGLWALRRHPFRAGWLFSLYLVANGVERFLIEQIRVNPEYTLLGLTPTQAEIIAVLLVIAGGVGLVWTGERKG